MLVSYTGDTPYISVTHPTTSVVYNFSRQSWTEAPASLYATLVSLGNFQIRWSESQNLLDDNVALRAVSTTTYTMTGNDYVIIADGTANTVTLTLPPTNTTKERMFVVKAINIANTVKIVPNGTDTIEGGVDFTFTGADQSVTLISQGSDWHVIAGNAVAGSGLSGVLTLDDGANWNVQLTFTNGQLTNQLIAASTTTPTATFV